MFTTNELTVPPMFYAEYGQRVFRARNDRTQKNRWTGGPASGSMRFG